MRRTRPMKKKHNLCKKFYEDWTHDTTAMATDAALVWQPLNLTQACPAHINIRACDPFVFHYMNLLVNLFDTSYDERVQKDLREGKFSEHPDVHPRVAEKYFFERNRENMDRVEEYDFIVVGAGSAGCVVSNRLSEVSDWEVLTLEAGSEQPDIALVPSLMFTVLKSNLDWRFMTQPDNRTCLASKGCSWSRGKMMGGSSSVNAFVYIRGDKLDFDNWAKLGNEGWGYDDVMYYFKKSENNMNIESLDPKYHATGGEQYVSLFSYIDKPSTLIRQAFNDTGLPLTDFNGASLYGVAYAQTITHAGVRASTNTGFIQPIRYKRPNLTIKTHSEVTKVLIDENKIAYGVQYLRNGKLHTALARKEVILSAGSIISPKLLMLSGIGPKKHLEELNIPVIKDAHVGRNLQDHVTLNGLVIALSNKTNTLVSDEEIIKDVHGYYNAKVKTGPLAANGPLGTLAFIKTIPNLPAPDIEYQIGNLFWRDYVKEPQKYHGLVMLPSAFYDGLQPRPMVLVPESRGWLELNPSNPLGPPNIHANYFDKQSDFDTLMRGIRFVLKLEDTPTFKKSGAYFVKTSLAPCEKFTWGTDEYFNCLIRAYTSTGFHPVGTCKMGPKWDKTAVVDPELRVNGVKRLRVIDASIMPVITRGNTNAPSIMIGEKGSDMVKQYWLRREYPCH